MPGSDSPGSSPSALFAGLPDNADTPLVQTRLVRFAQNAQGAFATNTLRAWRSDWWLFSNWCETNHHCALPAAAPTLVAFIDAMKAHRKPASLRRYLSSIGVVHQAAGLANPTQTLEVKLALKRAAREAARQGRARQTQAAPLTWAAIAAALPRLQDHPRDVFTKALVLVAYDGLCRAEELPRLRIEHLQWHADGDGVILLNRSKTDQEGGGHWLYLAPTTMQQIDRWLATHGNQQGPLFRPVFKSGQIGQRPISTAAVTRAFKRVAKAAGLDPQPISGHSCRVGASQDLMAAGFDLPTIMQAGRWKSARMPARYTEHLAAQRGGMAQLARKQKR